MQKKWPPNCQKMKCNLCTTPPPRQDGDGTGMVWEWARDGTAMGQEWARDGTGMGWDDTGGFHADGVLPR